MPKKAKKDNEEMEERSGWPEEETMEKEETDPEEDIFGGDLDDEDLY